MSALLEPLVALWRHNRPSQGTEDRVLRPAIPAGGELRDSAPISSRGLIGGTKNRTPHPVLALAVDPRIESNHALVDAIAAVSARVFVANAWFAIERIPATGAGCSSAT